MSYLNRTSQCFLVLLCVFGLAACGGSAYKPRPYKTGDGQVRRGSTGASKPSSTRSRPPSHLVQQGETLFSIAKKYGLDWKSLARVNDINEPYTIYPGLSLRLSARGGSDSHDRRQASRNTSGAKPSSGVVIQPLKPNSSTTVKKPATVKKPTEPLTKPKPSNVAWRWPVSGPVVARYVAGDPAKQGIDVSGQAGQPVTAAAAGTVVYSGNGLVGLGELIILKHNETWISAYGHNRKRLVKEGDSVSAGQVISEMGDTGTDRVKLHFEVRKNGKPVDPILYLPAR